MDTSTAKPGRGLVLLGLFVAVAGIVTNFVLGYLEILFVPWYLPIAITAGLLLVVAGMAQRRSIGRWVAFTFLLLLTGASWFLISYASLPAYAGPVAEGKAFPEFTALKADGSPFTQRDLEGVDSVLVFFRGRWWGICNIELVKLERRSEDFARRNVRVLVATMEGLDDVKLTQAEKPHLVVLCDKDRKLAEAAQVVHKNAHPTKGDANTPTTVLIDKSGTVRWVFRPNSVFSRLSPDDLLKEVDARLKK